MKQFCKRGHDTFIVGRRAAINKQKALGCVAAQAPILSYQSDTVNSEEC